MAWRWEAEHVQQGGVGRAANTRRTPQQKHRVGAPDTPLRVQATQRWTPPTCTNHVGGYTVAGSGINPAPAAPALLYPVWEHHRRGEYKGGKTVLSKRALCAGSACRHALYLTAISTVPWPRAGVPVHTHSCAASPSATGGGTTSSPSPLAGASPAASSYAPSSVPPAAGASTSAGT